MALKTVDDIFNSIFSSQNNYNEHNIKRAMQEYAFQFINTSDCYNCNGTGKVCNTNCITCKGVGKLIILPITTTTTLT